MGAIRASLRCWQFNHLANVHRKNGPASIAVPRRGQQSLLCCPALLLVLTLGSISTAQPISSVQRDENVVLFPALATPVPGSDTWRISFHGWIYETEPIGQWIAERVSQLDLDIDDLDDSSRTRLRERLAPFLVDNERGERIVVRVGGRDFVLDRSSPNGHFTGEFKLGAAEFDTLFDSLKARRPTDSARRPELEYEVVLPAGDARKFTGTVHVLERSGLSVISDIDDTIKLTEVHDRDALMRNTFVLPLRPAAGMAEAYRRLAERHSARFHYVSGSPWQLYGPLSEFLATSGFPAGSFHLRHFRFGDGSFREIFEAPEQHKLEAIQGLLARSPERSFVLVGDAGERDPEIYAEVCRRSSDAKIAVLVRCTGDVKRTRRRLKRAFADLPTTSWAAFSTAAEFESECDRLLSTQLLPNRPGSAVIPAELVQP